MAKTRSSYGALLCLAVVCLACLQSITASKAWSPRTTHDTGGIDHKSPPTGNPQDDRHKWDASRSPNNDGLGTSGHQGSRDSSPPTPHSDMSTGSVTIIGIVVGCILVCVLVAVLVLCFCLRKRRRNNTGAPPTYQEQVFAHHVKGSKSMTIPYTTMNEDIPNSATPAAPEKTPLPPPYPAPAGPLPTKNEPEAFYMELDGKGSKA